MKSTQIAVFWHVAPCNLAEICQNLGEFVGSVFMTEE
jgi:hypothetical protein